MDSSNNFILTYSLYKSLTQFILPLISLQSSSNVQTHTFLQLLLSALQGFFYIFWLHCPHEICLISPLVFLQIICLIGFCPATILFTYCVSFMFAKVQSNRDFFSVVSMMVGGRLTLAQNIQ